MSGPSPATPGQGRDDALPVTVLLPEAATSPITLYDGGAALQMAIVERAGVPALNPRDWDKPGVYVLLDLPAADGTWGCYAGQAAALRTRLLQHLAHKDHWRRALLIQRDTTFGYNSAQIGWLEGRLYDLLNAAGEAQLHNGNRPSDETLPAHDRLALEASIAPIRRVLRLIGYDPASPDDQPVPGTPKKTAQFHGITMSDLLTAGYLAAGGALTSTNGAWPATATVLPNGTVQVGTLTYSSPSAAASAVKGGGAANGWEFWAVETSTGNLPLATLRARYAGAMGQPTVPLGPTTG